MEVIDRAWLAAHPLPVHRAGTDKNGRGRVLVVGGSTLVPGAIRLTAEAAFRVGAGKVRMATVASAAIPLGVTMPEAAVVALLEDQDGEIALNAAQALKDDVARCDALVLGPGMSDSGQITTLVEDLLGKPNPELSIVMDAAAISCATVLARVIAKHQGRVVLTPHHGEMARLRGCSITDVEREPAKIALEIAAQFKAVVALKSHETLVATPAGDLVRYASDCVGLATGGSGDVLAGAIGGLLSQGADPLTATGWGVWVHGEAGRLLSSKIGRIGFIARELPAEFPQLLQYSAQR